MNLNKIKKIHFVGLGGIGVSAVAKMMLDYHKEVSGSDLNDSEIIRDLVRQGAKFFLGHSPENLDKKTDLVVYSPAVPENNLEREKAKKLKIPQFSYPEFLGELSKKKFTIAVSGTNGKSTTTALLGLILEAAGLDPTVIVGSQVPAWQGNLRIGKSRYLVVEACEWRAHMLNLWPKIIVLTNLELDHLDYYRNLDRIIKTFQRYVEKLSPIDLLIINADDPNLKKFQPEAGPPWAEKPKCRVITYGIRNQADIVVKNIKVGGGFQKFDLCLPCETSFLNEDPSSGKTEGFCQICNLKLRMPGLFNIYNTLAASTAALGLGVKPKIIKKTLENFKGIWRRFEIVGRRNGAIIVSDYAHHPTAVRGTIQAAREFYPNRRIIAVFQPHHHNRTKKLFWDFVKSFDQADLVIISEIYQVAGREREADSDVNSKDLVEAIMVRQAHHKIDYRKTKKIFYTPNLTETKKQLLVNLQPNDLVLIMGAGDIYQIVEDLLDKK